MSEENLWAWLGTAREKLGVLKYRLAKPVPQGSSPTGEKAEALIISLERLKTASPNTAVLSEFERALHGYLAVSIEEQINLNSKMLDHRDKMVAMKQRAEDAEAQVALLLAQAATEGPDTDYRAMRERAEQAERRARYLEQQLSAQADQQSPKQPPAAGLAFPYATKDLEAMRAAVAKYWESYTPDKRQPTQVEVQLELCELLGLERMKNGEPPRKAKELAAAIRPDTLPDA